MINNHRTTEDLRNILFDTLEGVKKGDIKPTTGKAVAVLAEKIIETSDLELRYAALNDRLLGSNNDAGGIGKVLLTEKKI